MLGICSEDGFSSMTAPLKTIDSTTDCAVLMHDIGRPRPGRRARAGARADGAEGRGARGDGGGDPRQQGRRSSPPMPGTWPRPRRPARRRPSSTGWRSTTSASPPWRTASTWSRALADPVGKVTERWTRPNGMTIERVRVPLGVDRRHLREPPERHGRRRRAVPQGRQCRRSCAAARRASARTARSMRRWPRGWRPPACPRPRSSWCRPATAPRSG